MIVTLLMTLFDESHRHEIMEKTASRLAEKKSSYWWKRPETRTGNCQSSFREGDACPACRQGKLAYDSLFILICPECGHVAESGAFS